MDEDQAEAGVPAAGGILQHLEVAHGIAKGEDRLLTDAVPDDLRLALAPDRWGQEGILPEKRGGAVGEGKIQLDGVTDQTGRRDAQHVGPVAPGEPLLGPGDDVDGESVGV